MLRVTIEYLPHEGAPAAVIGRGHIRLMGMRPNGTVDSHADYEASFHHLDGSGLDVSQARVKDFDRGLGPWHLVMDALMRAFLHERIGPGPVRRPRRGRPRGPKVELR